MTTLKYTGHMDCRTTPILFYPANDIYGDIAGNIILEIGPGRGDFLFHLAKANPDKVIYGIEMKGMRFEKLIKRRDTRKFGNIKLVMGDATEAVPKIFSKNSISAIYINFPDPWPKRRHEKNRLLSEPFLRTCTTLLTPNGILFIATDVRWYAEDTHKICNNILELRNLTDGITTDYSEYFPTYFAEKWLRSGRTLYYQKYQKISDHQSPP